MPDNLVFRTTLSDGDTSISKAGIQTIANLGYTVVPVALTSAQANVAIQGLAGPVSGIKAFGIYSPTLEVLLEINSSSAPDWKWTCPLGGLVKWCTLDGDSAQGIENPLVTASVTTITTAFLTNNTAAVGTAYVFFAFDGTP